MNTLPRTQTLHERPLQYDTHLNVSKVNQHLTTRKTKKSDTHIHKQTKATVGGLAIQNQPNLVLLTPFS